MRAGEDGQDQVWKQARPLREYWRTLRHQAEVVTDHREALVVGGQDLFEQLLRRGMNPGFIKRATEGLINIRMQNRIGPRDEMIVLVQIARVPLPAAPLD